MISTSKHGCSVKHTLVVGQCQELVVRDSATNCYETEPYSLSQSGKRKELLPTYNTTCKTEDGLQTRAIKETRGPIQLVLALSGKKGREEEQIAYHPNHARIP